jgi:hypothetical protein
MNLGVGVKIEGNGHLLGQERSAENFRVRK